MRLTVPERELRVRSYVQQWSLMIPFGCCVFYIACVASARAEILLGPISNPATGNDYYLLDAATWTESQKEAVSLGGNLATINSKAEEDWILRRFSNHDGESRNLWIGLNDADEEGKMVWASGEVSEYAHWVPGDPNDRFGEEDFVMIWGPHPGFAFSGYWNDLRNTAPKRQVYGVVEIARQRQATTNSALGAKTSRTVPLRSSQDLSPTQCYPDSHCEALSIRRGLKCKRIRVFFRRCRW